MKWLRGLYRRAIAEGDDFVRRLKSYGVAEIFLAIGCVAGIGFIIVTPPMQSPDEVEHFYRSYQVSDLKIVPDKLVAKGHGGVGEGYGGELPISVVKSAELLKGNVAGSMNTFHYGNLKAALEIPLDTSQKQKIRFDNTTIYSPIPYIPQAVGIAVGKVFNANPILLSYLGRLTNLLFWLLIIYFAIRITPIGKWAFAAIALNPVSVFLAAQLSSDAFSTAIAALFVGMVLHTRAVTKPLGTKYLIGLLSVTIMICLLKNAYLPLVLLLLVVPARHLSVGRKALFLGIGVAIGIVWNVLIYAAAKEIPEYFNITANIDPKAQVMYILNNLQMAVSNLFWNVLGTPSVGLNSTYNGLLGWGDTPLPFWISLVSFLAISFALLHTEVTASAARRILPRWVRLFSIGLLGVSAAAIIISLYLGWTEVSNRLIGGVQGRYYIPISFLLVPIFMYGIIKIQATKKDFSKVMIAMLVLVLSASLYIVAIRYSLGIWW